jgi:hypothetical protein
MMMGLACFSIAMSMLRHGFLLLMIYFGGVLWRSSFDHVAA